MLLGLDLVTGSFGLLPLPWIENDTDGKAMLANWGWVFLGNLIGSVVYGGLLAIALTNFGATAPAGVAAKIIAIAQAKTTGYEALGFAGHRSPCSSRRSSATGWSASPSSRR